MTSKPFHSTSRVPGVTYAVSDTGPLISAFQSESFALLARIFAKIYVPMACVAELVKHGWQEEVQAATSQLIALVLTNSEEERALAYAGQIAQQPDSGDPVPENHLGEAQAIMLALRPEYRTELLLLDELAARAVARKMELRLSGFPGVLLLATRSGLISAEELRERLETCRRKGTHYGTKFIQEVYRMAQLGRRPK